MYRENTKTIAIPIYKVLPYLVITHGGTAMFSDKKLRCSAISPLSDYIFYTNILYAEIVLCTLQCECALLITKMW